LRHRTLRRRGRNLYDTWLGGHPIAQRIDIAGPHARHLIEQIATAAPPRTYAPHEAVRAHLEALRGWSHISDRLPDPVVTDGGIAARTWRLVDELIFPIIRADLPWPEHVTLVWDELSDLCRPTAVDALLQLRSATSLGTDMTASVYRELLHTYPEQIRKLFEWAVEHWDQVRPSVTAHVVSSRQTVVQDLGHIGDAGTEAILRRHLAEPKLAPTVVDAIRAIQLGTKLQR